MDKIITLKIGDIAETPTTTNIYTGKHRHYAVPHDRIVWGDTGNGFGEINLGTMLRISQSDKQIITNPRFTGHAVTCFLDKKYKGMIVLAIQITKISKASVCGEPIDWIELKQPIEPPDIYDELCEFTGYDIHKDLKILQGEYYNPVWHEPK